MKIRVRRGILISLVMLLFLSTGAIWLAGDWAGRSSAAALTQQLMKRVRDGVTQRLARDLGPAMAVAKQDAGFFASGVLSLDLANDAVRERIVETFETQVRHFKVDQFFVGDNSGNFLLVGKKADGRIEHRVILPAANVRTQTFIAADGSRTEQPYDKAFDLAERPWFKGAKAHGLHWTDVYTFSDSKSLGITASAAIMGGASGNDFLGAVGIDVTLASLSDFLAHTEISEHGRAFLLDANGNIVAHPDKQMVVTAEGQQVAAANSADPVLATGFQRFQAAREKMNATGHAITAEEPFRTKLSLPDDYWQVMISPVAADASLPEFAVGVALPERDFLGDIKANQLTSGFIALAAIGFGVLLAVIVTRGIAGPILRLEDAMNRVQRMDLDVNMDISTNYIEIEHMVKSFGRMVHGLRSFSRFVPRDVVLDLIAAGQSAEVGGQEREISMFFSDIEGFTSIAEATPTRQLFDQLGEYFEGVVDVLKDHHGTLDKFIGDAVMAFWNAPVADPNHRLNCVLAAVDVNKRLETMNATWASEGRPPFATRIGISTGPVMVGNVGSSSRLNYTALGDHVNLAARLEGTNKFYGTNIIASEFLLDGLPENKIIVQPLDIIAVKGRATGVRIFEVLGRAGEVDAKRLDAGGLYGEAFALYLDRQFAEAEKRFARVKALLGHYLAADEMIHRCRNFQAQAPGDDWRGVYTAKTK